MKPQAPTPIVPQRPAEDSFDKRRMQEVPPLGLSRALGLRDIGFTSGLASSTGKGVRSG